MVSFAEGDGISREAVAPIKDSEVNISMMDGWTDAKKDVDTKGSSQRKTGEYVLRYEWKDL